MQLPLGLADGPRSGDPAAAPLAVVDDVEQIGPCPRDTRPDRSDRATDHGCGVAVGAAHHLCQHERLSAARLQSLKEVVDLGGTGVARGQLRHIAAVAPDPPALPPPGLVGTGVAGDGQQPTPGTAGLAELVERAERPFIDLLHEVLGAVGVAEMPAQCPHIVLGASHECFEGVIVAVAPIDQELGEGVHRDPVCLAGNRSGGWGDHEGMDCDAATNAISARVDGELAAVEEARLDRHVERCPGCRAWEDRAFRLRRVTTMRRSGPPPELAERVLRRVGVPDVGTGQWVRYTLGVIAGSLTVLNAPLLLGSTSASDVHEARHLGAFGVALGAGLLWAAIRPERAIGLVPLAVAFAAAMTIGAAVDLVEGETSALAEGHHTLEISGLALLWLLSGGRHRLSRRLQLVRMGTRLRSA